MKEAFPEKYLIFRKINYNFRKIRLSVQMRKKFGKNIKLQERINIPEAKE